MNPPPECMFVPWDSEYFSLRIGRIRERRLSIGMIERVVAWRDSAALDCLYALLDPDDATGVWAVEDRGFRLMDLRVELTLDLAETGKSDESWPSHVAAAIPEDVDVLCDIAASAHRGGRYLNDPRFPEPARSAIYPTWIRNSCAGWAARVWVYREKGRPTGYLTCHLDEGRGEIGLVGVSRGSQGQGVGKALMTRALQWFREHGAKHVQVVTQGSNSGAIRYYERHGFRTQQILLWYHGWRV